MALLPGVKQLLSQLKQDGFLIGIATMGAGDVARRVLSHNRNDTYFSEVLTVDDGMYSKPDPENIVRTASQLDTTYS